MIIIIIYVYYYIWFIVDFHTVLRFFANFCLRYCGFEHLPPTTTTQCPPQLNIFIRQIHSNLE